MKQEHVPWYDWDEWYHVYTRLFDEEESQKRWAIDRVRIWSIRFGKIPHAVECTVNLIDYSLQKDSEPTMLQHAIGMCIVRMINGYKLQQQRTQLNPKDDYFVSVRDAMQEIDMPPIIVEIRHAMSHKSLPSLSLLQHASSLAVEWLKENYWEKQHNLIAVYHTSLLTRLNSYTSKTSTEPIVKLLDTNVYDLILNVAIMLLFDLKKKNRIELIQKTRVEKLEPLITMLKDASFVLLIIKRLFAIITSIAKGNLYTLVSGVTLDESHIELSVLWLREIIQAKDRLYYRGQETEQKKQAFMATLIEIQQECKINPNKM
jgi:hypothetical protein